MNINKRPLFWTIFSLFSLTISTFIVGYSQSNLTYKSSASLGIVAPGKPPEQIKDLSTQLNRKTHEFTIASENEKSDKLSQLTQLIQTRKEKFKKLMEENPQEALELSIPQEVHDKLPEWVKKDVETTVELEGTLEIAHFDDFEKETSIQHFFLKEEGANNLTRLHFPKEKPEINPDIKLKVQGVKLDDQMVVETSETDASVLPANTSITTRKKVAVILFNFTNNTTQPYTVDQIRQATFTNTVSVNSYYKEASFNQWELIGHTRPDGDVFGWYTIPDDNANCSSSFNSWASAADQLVQNDGVDLSVYNVKIYKFPTATGCPGSAWAYIGGNPGRSWINTNYSVGVVTHEVGHNFGTDHAGSMTCTEGGVRVPISATCTTKEYGDPFDVMGSASGTHHMNNYNKGKTGTYSPNWFSSSNKATVTTNGTYTIAPAEHSTDSVQALLIPKDYFSPTSVYKYYYLEYRQPFGVFDAFPSSNPVVNGVSIRIAQPFSVTAKSSLLDMTPATTSFLDSALAPNQTFNDAIAGIQVQTLSVSPENAVVNITTTQGTCTPANPTVSISPAQQSGQPGAPLSYILTITNNDTLACNDTTFSIVGTLPSGLSQTLSNDTVTIAPKAQATVTAIVTSAVGTVDGYYQFEEQVASITNTTLAAATTATYILLPTDTQGPIVTFNQPQNGAILSSKGSETISASAIDPSGISSMMIAIDGKTEKTCTGSPCSTNWTLSKAPAGTHTITATATDNSPNRNIATTSITVTKN